MYSGLPKPAAKAKAPFCINPAAQAVQPTMASTKLRYWRGEASRKTAVEIVSRPKMTLLMTRARLIRKGYEAEDWMLERMSTTARVVRVETARMVDWKFASIQASPAKREAKYGAAARNMFL